MLAVDHRTYPSFQPASSLTPSSPSMFPSTSTAVLPNKDVRTSFNYFTPTSVDAPYQYMTEPPEGVPRHNLSQDPRSCVVRDLRGMEHLTKLDVMGFQYIRHCSSEKQFIDEDRIKEVYYPEVEDLLKKETGAKRVFLFEHTIRRNYLGKEGLHTNAPAHRVHIDQTFQAAIARVHRHLGDEAGRLLQSRTQIVNVWRPISHPVAHNPLGVLDYRTFNLDDMVPVRLIFRDREGSVCGVRPNSRHEWFYLSDQTPEEVLLIKCFDSLDDGKTARCSPHSAFRDDSSPANAPQRESIEVRALLFDSE